MRCRICGSENNAETISVREMMIPTRERFDYFTCLNCNCLQIKDIPCKLSAYYGNEYYSFDGAEDAPTETPVSDNTPILDVGCGSGKFLKKLRESGYGNLRGCDPFLPQDIFYGKEIKIWKKTIHEIEGQFEQIYMNDSFEHMCDPHEVMDSVHRLLTDKGMARIKIPIYPNIAFDLYGEHWYQIDAPRHIFLHSRKSMEILTAMHNLRIVEVTYDSDSSQIFRSFLYSKDIPFWEQSMSMIRETMDNNEIDEISRLTQEANEKQYGDHAVFYIVKDV